MMLFDTLYQELANGLQTFPALWAGITQAEAEIRPFPESWSILEVVCHLYDEEREDFRQRLDITLHQPAGQWPGIDPQSWVTERAYNQQNLAEMTAKFIAERQKSLAWLQTLQSPNWEAEYSDSGGSMKAGEMFASWVAHDNLHMRQLVELRRSRIVQITAPYDVQYAGEW